MSGSDPTSEVSGTHDWLSPEVLLDLAGSAVLERGESYFRDGRVRLRTVQPDRVTADVEGGEVYRVEFRRGVDMPEGTCTCPAAERGYCKHMAAVAFAVTQAPTSNTSQAKAILSYLGTKTASELVELLMAQASRYPELFNRIHLLASVSSESDDKLERELGRQLKQAIRVRRFVDYKGAGAWARRVREALEMLADLTAAGRGKLVRRLANLAMDEIERALDLVDDSDGYGYALLYEAKSHHRTATLKGVGDPTMLARELFAAETKDGFDTFADAFIDYRDALGDVGLAEYRRLANDAWQALPARGPRSRDNDSGYQRLESILDWFAEQEGDFALRVSLRRKDLSSPWRYVQLAKFCGDAGHLDEAIRFGTEGLWVFEGQSDNAGLTELTAMLLVDAGRAGEANELLWRLFERTPSYPLYLRLRQIDGEAAVERAIRLLTSRSASRADADVLVNILIDERNFDAAWAAAEDVSLETKQRLARESASSHPDHVVSLYKSMVENLVLFSDNQRYQEAAKVIERIGALLGPAEFADYVGGLRQLYGRKRNFMKLLG